MDTVAEAQVLSEVSMDVESVGVGEAALVAIGRGDYEQESAALRDCLAVVLDVLGQVAGDVGPGDS